MSDVAKLDEVALRKPGFHEGVRVALADGQEWALPEFRYRFFPGRDDDGKIVAKGRVTYGPERDRDIDLVLGALEVDPGDRLDAKLRVAAELLLANYDLTDDMLADLLPMEMGDEGLTTMWRDILLAIQGVSVPKASPVG
jgi:hypothetical protein